MRRLTIVLTVVALTAAAAPSPAQVYPERIRSVSRTPVREPAAELYQRGSSRETETERFTRTVKVGTDGEIDVSNISGDIVVTLGSGEEATIEVVKTARAQSADDARALLPLVQVDIADRGNRVEIRTRYPGQQELRRLNRRNANVSVAFNISAPESARITARSISGEISVRDIRGDLQLESVSGTLRIVNGGRVTGAKTISGNVEISDTRSDGGLEASSVSGNVEMRAVAARRVTAGSISGNVILQDVASERVSGQAISGSVRFGGELTPSGRYDLKSHSGDVRLVVAGSTGFELDASSFSGNVRSDVPITIRGGDRRRQRSISGTWGDGSAILELTTFSGSIVIGRR